MDSALPILLSMITLSVVLSSLFLMAWFTLGRRPYTLVWAAAFVLASLQWLFNLSRDAFSNSTVYWMTVTFLGLGVVYLAYAGHLLRANLALRAPLMRAGIASLAAWLATYGVTEIHPNPGFAIGIQPLVGGLILGLSATVILRARAKPLAAEWGAAIVTGLFAASQILAGAYGVAEGMQFDTTSVGIYRQINFAFMPAAYAGTSLFMVFVLAAELADELRLQAVRDPLTGMMNRRGLEERADALIKLCQRRQSPIAAVMIDIDHFKSINDRWGHAAGDRVLLAVAHQLSREQRASDVIARIGGEEFLVLMPDTSKAQAHSVAERIRRRIAEAQTDSLHARVTASLGIAEGQATDADVWSLAHRADEALYRAKSEGRNRVTDWVPAEA